MITESLSGIPQSGTVELAEGTEEIWERVQERVQEKVWEKVQERVRESVEEGVREKSVGEEQEEHPGDV